MVKKRARREEEGSVVGDGGPVVVGEREREWECRNDLQAWDGRSHSFEGKTPRRTLVQLFDKANHWGGDPSPRRCHAEGMQSYRIGIRDVDGSSRLFPSQARCQRALYSQSVCQRAQTAPERQVQE